MVSFGSHGGNSVVEITVWNPLMPNGPASGLGVLSPGPANVLNN